MPKVNFNYDIKKDAWSWVVIAKDKNLWGLNWENEIAHIPKDLLSIILQSSFSNAINITEEYIKNSSKIEYNRLIIKEEINSLKNSWRHVEAKYFKTLEDIMKKPAVPEKIGCFWTTGFMCPYNEKENWFMISIWHSIPFSITTICHEIMHFQFLYYYRDYLKKKGLKNNQIDDLKEALTFLLNELEFDEIILYQDAGYPDHRELREKLKNNWLKNKNFQNLINVAVSIIKK